MNEANIETAEDEVCVLLDEEYGYRFFFWFPNMELAEFLEWWRGLESVEGFDLGPDSTAQLPGKTVRIKGEDQWNLWHTLCDTNTFPYCHFFNDGDSFVEVGNKIYHHKGFDSHYYDPKPTDITMTVDGQGNVVCHHTREEESACPKCQERNGNAEKTVDVSKLSRDTEKEKG